MSQISAAAVNELRKRTDRPLMECKKALTETSGDLDKAVDLLRGAAVALMVHGSLPLAQACFMMACDDASMLRPRGSSTQDATK